MMEASPDLSCVVIDRRIGEVYVGRKRVARWDGARLKLKGEALALRTRIEELIEEKPPKKESDSE